MRLRYLTLCLLIGAVIFSGCASPARMEKMIISPGALENYQGNTKLRHSLSIKEVLGGKESDFAGRPTIRNKEFKEALLQSLEDSQLMSPKKPGKYQLSANLIYVEDAIFGWEFTITTVAKYVVVENNSNTELYNKVIRTLYTATMDDAFFGPTRLRLAQEGSARKNITQLIDELYGLK